MTFNIKIEKSGIEGCGVYDTPSKTIETRKFETLKEARREIRRMMKEEGYKRLNYCYVNFNLGTELSANF